MSLPLRQPMERAENLSRCLALIGREDVELSPDVRFIAIRLLFLYGDSVFNVPGRELAKQIGVSYDVFCKGREKMTTLNIFSQAIDGSSIPEKRSGRPPTSFQLSSKFMAKLDGYSQEAKSILVGSSTYRKILDTILFWMPGTDSLRTGNQAKSDKNTQFGVNHRVYLPATRMVIAVLVSFADQTGAVRIGKGRLARLTGMTVDRLESQLAIIESMGVLLTNFPGLTFQRIIGKAEGGYFLNLTCDLFVESGITHAYLFLKSGYDNEYTTPMWGGRIYGAANNGESISGRNFFEYKSSEYVIDFLNKKSIDWGLDVINKPSGNDLDLLVWLVRRCFDFSNFGMCGNDNSGYEEAWLFAGNVSDSVLQWTDLFLPFEIENFFKESKSAVKAYYLQCRLDKYASSIINCGFKFLDPKRVVVHEDILRDIHDGLFGATRGAHNVATSTKSALAFFLYCVAYQHAWMIGTAVAASLLAISSEMKRKFYDGEVFISILPNHGKRSFRAMDQMVSLSFRDFTPPEKIYAAVHSFDVVDSRCYVEKIYTKEQMDKINEISRGIGYTVSFDGESVSLTFSRI